MSFTYNEVWGIIIMSNNLDLPFTPSHATFNDPHHTTLKLRVCLDWAYCCWNWKLKTENRKHCSKIIFKCVNSIVGPMNSVWTVREQCVNSIFYLLYSAFTVHVQEKKKKKAGKRRAETQVSALPKRSL